MKTLKVKSLVGTEIIIDFDAAKISAPSKGFSEKIYGWGTTTHEGKTVKFAKVSGDRNILIFAAYYADVVEAIDEKAREDYTARKAAIEAAIPGLAALESAIAAEDGYLNAFNSMMDDEQNDGARPPTQPPKRQFWKTSPSTTASPATKPTQK